MGIYIFMYIQRDRERTGREKASKRIRIFALNFLGKNYISKLRKEHVNSMCLLYIT